MQSIIALVICILSFLLVILIYYKFIYKQCHYRDEIIYITGLNDITQHSPNPPPYQSNQEGPPPYSERESAFSERRSDYNRLSQHSNSEIQNVIIL